MLAPERFTPVRSALDRRAPERFAPVMVAPEKCAPGEADPARSAKARFAPPRRVRDSFACIRLAVARSARVRLAPVRSAPVRLAFRRSARARFLPARWARGHTVHAFFGATLQLDIVRACPAASPTVERPAVTMARASRAQNRRTSARAYPRSRVVLSAVARKAYSFSGLIVLADSRRSVSQR